MQVLEDNNQHLVTICIHCFTTIASHAVIRIYTHFLMIEEKLLRNL